MDDNRASRLSRGSSARLASSWATDAGCARFSGFLSLFRPAARFVVLLRRCALACVRGHFVLVIKADDVCSAGLYFRFAWSGCYVIGDLKPQ